MEDLRRSIETDSDSREFMVDFALPSWYDNLKELTIKTLFLDLPEDFVEYLSSDGCTLPQGCFLPSFPLQQRSEDEEEPEGEEWSDEETEAPPSFPALIAAMSEAIASLGSKGVFPKLNWSAPRDAVWMSATGSVCCNTPAEVVLLLKSSDFITHDLSLLSDINLNRSDERPSVKCTLCLRAWQDIMPSSELRCFVRDHQLVGVAQRAVHTHFPYLFPIQELLLQELQVFISRLQSHTHLDHAHLRHYVCDVSRKKEGDYVLVDLNPFSAPTEPLLFSWEELQGWAGPPEVRLVEPGCVQPSSLHAYRLPKDFVDLSTGADIHKFVDLFHAEGLGRS